MLRESGFYTTNVFVVSVTGYDDSMYFIKYPSKEDILKHYICDYLGLTEFFTELDWNPVEYTCRDDRIQFGDEDEDCFVTISCKQLTFNV
jgi:hypothetical protein